MPSADPLAYWPDFAQAVWTRLEKGRAEYGDASFKRPPEELAAEIEEELADVCGWAFVLWCRVGALRERIAGIAANGGGAEGLVGDQTRQKAGAGAREERLYPAQRFALRLAEAARALGIVLLRGSESGEMRSA
jgi:hypothetical protein